MINKITEQLIDLFQSSKCKHWFLDNADMLWLANYLVENNIRPIPALPGDTLFEIRKVCSTNAGRKEEYKPITEYETPCKYFEPASWYDDCDECNAIDDIDERSYCELNLNILCDECKGRFTIQKTKFEWSDMTRVVGTPMFDEATETRYRKYLTEDAAKKALEVMLDA